MKTKIFLISFMFLMAGQIFAQGRGNDKGKYKKEYYKKEMEWQREHDKKMAEYHREMRKKEQEYYRELAKEEREYYKELRKRELEHLKDCHACDHAFYHNDDHYYEEDVYYSTRTRRPISVDAEVVFGNGSVRVRL